VETERREKEETGGEEEGKRQRRSTKGKRQKKRDRQERQKTKIRGGEEERKEGIYRGETMESDRVEKQEYRGKRQRE
jgi:hypothetical protein